MSKYWSFYRPDYEYRYVIYNDHTDYILFQTNDYERAKHIWNHIPRRKNGTLYLVDTSDGNLIKTRESKNRK